MLSYDALPRADYAPPQLPWNGVMLVGEAPGAEEVKQNRPFVGRSGQLLNQVLSEVGLKREACFIANVFRAQPPRNRIAEFFISAKQAKKTAQAVAPEWGKYGGKFCLAHSAGDLAFLQETLKAQRPQVIVAVGLTALWALTGQDRLAVNLAAVLSCRMIPESPVIAVWHPSYLLRGNRHLLPAWQAQFARVHILLGDASVKSA
jgi:uracil-DNA glycosylase